MEATPMPEHYTDPTVTLHHGDCLDELRSLANASVDAVVTDPPYGLEFMGKAWDAPWSKHFTSIGDGAPLPDRQLHVNPSCRTCGGYQRGTKKPCRCELPDWKDTQAAAVARKNRGFQEWCEVWTTECFRVLKPGGHMLAFGGTRTFHRLACAVEDAGFEVRDSLAWLYASGFPKSLNLVDDNGERTGWGTALKPAFEPIVVARKPLAGTVAANVLAHGTGALNIDGCRLAGEDNPAGRWPANVILDESQAAELDAQSGESVSRSGGMSGTISRGGIMNNTGEPRTDGRGGHDDLGGASRFFYVAKADQSERVRINGVAHPTVKPLDIMRWLVRLVAPPGGTVLEPFAGSGTTVEACILEGFKCIAIEREADYLPLIVQRVNRRRDPVAAVKSAGEDGGLFDLLDNAVS